MDSDDASSVSTVVDTVDAIIPSSPCDAPQSPTTVPLPIPSAYPMVTPDTTTPLSGAAMVRTNPLAESIDEGEGSPLPVMGVMDGMASTTDTATADVNTTTTVHVTKGSDVVEKSVGDVPNSIDTIPTTNVGTLTMQVDVKDEDTDNNDDDNNERQPSIKQQSVEQESFINQQQSSLQQPEKQPQPDLIKPQPDQSGTTTTSSSSSHSVVASATNWSLAGEGLPPAPLYNNTPLYNTPAPLYNTSTPLYTPSNTGHVKTATPPAAAETPHEEEDLLDALFGVDLDLPGGCGGHVCVGMYAWAWACGVTSTPWSITQKCT